MSAAHPSPARPRLVEPNPSGGKRIKEVRFGLLSTDEMERLAEFECDNRELYTPTPDRQPAPNGCLDPRLGAASKSSPPCPTCGKKIDQCAGHYGVVKLALPVFHAGYFKHVLALLQCVCKQCSRALSKPEERRKQLHAMRTARDVLAKQGIHKRVLDQCKSVTKCPHCGARNGPVRRVAGAGALRVAHETWRGVRRDELEEDDEFNAFARSLHAAAEKNSDLRATLGVSAAQNADVKPKASKAPASILSPADVREVFCGISDDDCELLWLDPIIGRPENLVLNALLVPPTPIRPSVAVEAPGGAGTNEDDLTIKLQEIIDVNESLKKALREGAATKILVECWSFLQTQVALYINGEVPGMMPRQQHQKPMRGLCQRLKGKSGRFRGNLSGKRVDFSARTVISPDPNLRIDQVGVPTEIARTMTYPERVNRHNLEHLRTLIINGPKQWPGANYVEKRAADQSDGDRVVVGAVGAGQKKSLKYGDRDATARDLKIGDVVERHMCDGDVVLFNRQPSLHKLSIMCHTVKVMDDRTFRFNECVCAPYNADFDGDEMNLHLPQTEEARAEALSLMGVTKNICTPRNGEPLVAATQDFVTAAFLLTQPDVFFSREVFCQICSYAGDASEHITLPPPAVLKPVMLWTGKQVFSLLIRPNDRDPLCVSFECEEKSYNPTDDKYLCPNDGYVIIRRSKLLSGSAAKRTVGEGCKKGLIYALCRDHSSDRAATFMNRLAKLASRYLGGHRGFSIGLDDVTPSKELTSFKGKLMSEAFTEATRRIEAFKTGKLELRPGCDAAQSLETELTGLLGRVREHAGSKLMGDLPRSNSPRIMAECGSKGSALNVSQMIACLGQQAVDGKRIQNGFVRRTLPHFQVDSLDPAARGFVSNSFYSGLTATEFFFHTMGGREGLVDTAVKTAQTGYMARRLMKALEDLSVSYDGTVRNSEKAVVQFAYGDDGLDPVNMETSDGKPVDFARLLHRVRHDEVYANEKPLSPEMLVKECERIDFVSDLPPESAKFVQDARIFITGRAAECIRTRDALITGPSAKRSANESVKAFDVISISKRQLTKFADLAREKYLRSRQEPGEAVGAIGAQCISEPGTQMTLKTFHFAGVASMNVTLGVPRLTEIINASKKISTPIITAKLENDSDPEAARVVKAGLEKTTLGEVCLKIEEVYAPAKCYLSVQLDTDLIGRLHLKVDAASARQAVLRGVVTGGKRAPPIIRALKVEHVTLNPNSPNEFRVELPDDPQTRTFSGGGGALRGQRKPVPQASGRGKGKGKNKKKRKKDLEDDVIDTVDQRDALSDDRTYFAMQALKNALPNVVVSGFPAISRAVVAEEDGKYSLLVEGYGLGEVMGAVGVDGVNCTTNHVAEVESVLGIEAARVSIVSEVSYIMSAYGIGIDPRHLLLLADVMTFKGMVLGITRFGVSKMRESVLMLASFERTTDHLFDAAVHGRSDQIVGVSECIIMGIPVPLGCGSFKLLMDGEYAEQAAEEKKRPLILGASPTPR